MSIEKAIRAAAPNAPAAAIVALEKVSDDIGFSSLRLAHLIGQCAHESSGFTVTVENLFYTTASRLRSIWPQRFKSNDHAAEFTRNPERLANHVYGGRMGNTRPGDGFKYRGRGYLQLTGRRNYARYGKIIGFDLEDMPAQAHEPETAWRIAIAYMDTHRSMGKTSFEWADEDNVERVTRTINGGFNGLSDRRLRTAAALFGLQGGSRVLRKGSTGSDVRVLQRILTERGFMCGPLDGDFGPWTELQVKKFQTENRLVADGVAGPVTLAALGLT